MPQEPWAHMKTLFVPFVSFCISVPQCLQHPNMEPPWSCLHRKWWSALPPDSRPTSLGCLAEVWLFNLLHFCQEVIHFEGLRGTGYKWCILVLEKFSHQLPGKRWWTHSRPNDQETLTSNTRKGKHRNYRFGNLKEYIFKNKQEKK